MGRALKRPTVSEVLSGRASPSIGQLFALIREVNPTDRALPQEEAQARYLTKTRLIEVLLARFGDDLVLEPEGDGEGDRGQRKLHPADATHLLLSQLDEEWRSWVRRRLDEAEPSVEVASQPAVGRPQGAVPQGQTSLLVRGRVALGEYDFEEAEACWRLAIEQDQDLEAARALLSLWVDQLGRDEDASRLAPELEAEVLADPTIRGLLALAAARSSRVAEAREWLLGPPIDAGRHADVLAALVQAELTPSTLPDAEAELHQLRSLAPGHVAIEALTRDLNRLRAEARRPLEVGLEAALDRGDWSEVERQAEAIKARWPDSEVAGRSLARVARIRTEAAVVDLRQEIDAADRAHDFPKVVECLRRLKGLAPGPSLDTELAAAIARAREQEARAGVASLRAALAQAVTARELSSFLELPPSARAEVVAAVPAPELLWLEAFEAGRAKVDPAEKVELAIAATLAEALLAQGRPEQAWEHVVAHERRLASISRGRSLLESCRRQWAQAQEVRAAGRLSEAEVDLAEGRVEAASALLQNIEPAHLLPEANLRWTRAKAQADNHLALARQERALQEAMTAGAHLEAKKALDRLMALDDPGKREVHLATRAQLEAEINRSWDLRDLRPESEDEGAIDLRDVVLPSGSEGPLGLVATDQRTLVWVEVRRTLVFVRTLDVESGAVIRAVIFRTPIALGNVSLRLEGELLWLAGDRGGLLAYAWRRAEIVDWWELGKHLDPEESFEHLDVLAGGRFALMSGLVRREGRSRLRMIDLDRDREHRSLANAAAGHRVLPSAQDARLAILYVDGGVGLHAASGNVLHGGALPIQDPLELAVSPDGRGFVLLQELPATDDPEDRSMWVRRLSSTGNLGPATELLGSGPDLVRTLASSRTSGWVYVHFRALSEDPSELEGELLERMVPQLAAFEPTGEGYELRWRLRVPETTVLLADAEEQVVLVGFGGPKGPHFERLGHTPPTPPKGGPHRAKWRASIDVCSPQAPEGAKVSAKEWSAGDRLDTARSRALAEKNQNSPAALAHLIYTASALKGLDTGPLRSILLDRYPDHPDTCLLLASELVREREWQAAAKVLSGVNQKYTDEGHRQHRSHLMAELLLQLGDVAGAREMVEAAAKAASGGPTDCHLDTTFKVIAATERLLQGDKLAEEDWIGQLVQTIRATDEALTKDDRLEALRLIDAPAVWHARELQSAARRTTTYLRLESPEDVFRFRKTAALSAFIELMQARPPFATFSIPVYLATWEGSFLRKLEEDAKGWLASSVGTGTYAGEVGL